MLSQLVSSSGESEGNICFSAAHRKFVSEHQTQERPKFEEQNTYGIHWFNSMEHQRQSICCFPPIGGA